MSRKRPAVPKFWFSLRSPYSWLAYNDLLAQHAELADRLVWRPFFEPDELSRKLLDEAGGSFPYTPMSREKHRYILQDVRRLASARGLEFRWPVDREPVWEVPHLAYLVADRRGRGRAFIAAAAHARWQEARDICDPAVVASLGEEIGLDGAELGGAAEDPEIRDEGVRVLLELQRDGVFGVPLFTLHMDKFWGVDRLADFVDAVARQDAAAVRREPASSVAAPAGAEGLGLRAGGSVDDGHAGGCG